MRWRYTFTTCARSSSRAHPQHPAASATSCRSQDAPGQQRDTQPDEWRPLHAVSFLLSGILALVSLSLAVSGLIGYLEANHEMEELFDARLAQSARITNQLLSRYLKQRGELPSNGAVYQEWGAGRARYLPSGEAQLQPAGAGQTSSPPTATSSNTTSTSSC